MTINISQHKTHRKIHSQEKTVQQNKTNTFTGVNQSITPGHHSEWNNWIRLIVMTFEYFKALVLKFAHN